MSENAEAERVARWLEGIAAEARELASRAARAGDDIQGTAQGITAALAQKWARHIREGRHRDTA